MRARPRPQNLASKPAWPRGLNIPAIYTMKEIFYIVYENFFVAPLPGAPVARGPRFIEPPEPPVSMPLVLHFGHVLNRFYLHSIDTHTQTVNIISRAYC